MWVVSQNGHNWNGPEHPTWIDDVIQVKHLL